MINPSKYFKSEDEQDCDQKCLHNGYCLNKICKCAPGYMGRDCNQGEKIS